MVDAHTYAVVCVGIWKRLGLVSNPLWGFSTSSAADCRDGIDEGSLLWADVSTLSFSKSVGAQPSPVVVFGLKKPFKLCWPFPDMVGVVAVEPDFERFKALLVDEFVADRFLLVPSIGFVALEDGLASSTFDVALVSDTISPTSAGAVSMGVVASLVIGLRDIIEVDT